MKYRSGPLQEQFNHNDGAVFGRIVRLYWNPDTGGDRRPTNSIDFEIYEPIGLDGPAFDSPPFYYSTEERQLGKPTTTDLDAAVPDVFGFVKWDGCTQVYFADKGPALHCDDCEGLAGVFAAITRVQRRCYEILKVDAE